MVLKPDHFSLTQRKEVASRVSDLGFGFQTGVVVLGQRSPRMGF